MLPLWQNEDFGDILGYLERDETFLLDDRAQKSVAKFSKKSLSRNKSDSNL